MAMTLVSPAGRFTHDVQPLAARTAVTDATVVGLFSNQKANADLLMENLKTLLSQKFPAMTFRHFSKMASVPADFTAEFLDQCDVAVAAFAD